VLEGLVDFVPILKVELADQRRHEEPGEDDGEQVITDPAPRGKTMRRLVTRQGAPRTLIGLTHGGNEIPPELSPETGVMTCSQGGRRGPP
jgi:hypothetical protein